MLRGNLLLVLLFAAPVSAQRVSRSEPRILAVFSEVVARPSQSTVRVRWDNKDVALGTIVSADGLILTKASELKGQKITCKLKDGRDLEAKRIGTDEKFDLVLLKVEAKDLTPVAWSDSKSVRPGRWIASPGIGSEPVAIGVISVATRDLAVKGAPPPNPNSGQLGAGVDLDFAGVKINQIAAGSPAQKAGLKANDLVQSINGEAVNNADEFIAGVQRFKPGDVLTLKVLRGEKEMELKATLAKRTPGKGNVQETWGSQLSERRTGFPTILQHDSILKPSDCGGPLVDLDGKAIGINIARAGRTESYAIPTEVVRPLIEKLQK
jgi:serine protease Do